MTSEDLRELWAMVWAFRAEMEDDFPTPGRDDALAFAFTEAAEAVDAQLRQNPRYKRNNDKEHSIERELTQCAMMLLTAVPRTWRGWGNFSVFWNDPVWTLRNIAIRVAFAMEVPSDIEYILTTVVAINTAVDLSVMLPAELNRMRAKHKPVNNTNGGGAIMNVYDKDGALIDTRTVYVQKREKLVLADYAEGNGVE